MHGPAGLSLGWDRKSIPSRSPCTQGTTELLAPRNKCAKQRHGRAKNSAAQFGKVRSGGSLAQICRTKKNKKHPCPTHFLFELAHSFHNKSPSFNHTKVYVICIEGYPGAYVCFPMSAFQYNRPAVHTASVLLCIIH